MLLSNISLLYSSGAMYWPIASRRYHLDYKISNKYKKMEGIAIISKSDFRSTSINYVEVL